MKNRNEYQKLRGGYYTPEPIANFLVNWAVNSSSREVLEPSCGDGVFLNLIAKKLLRYGNTSQEINQLIHGIELDSVEFTKAKGKLETLGINGDNIINGDFFAQCNENFYGETLFGNQKRFDVVIGNPPFIRYQDFPDSHRNLAFQMMKRAGFNPNKLTNIWVPFLTLSSLLLKGNGRLAMVIPAELFQVNYSAETRKFLSDYFWRLTIVTFKKLVFSDIQQEVVLLLGERNNKPNAGIRTVELHDEEDLKTLSQKAINLIEIKNLDHTKEKWVKYFLTNKEIELLREYTAHPLVTLSGDVLDIDVGVVTGDNDYFLLSNSDLAKLGLRNHVKYIVSRSAHLSGIFFNENDFQGLADNDFRINLFSPDVAEKDKLPKKVREYIDFGEQTGVHKGYKCSIRDKWYIVPSIWSPDAFMLRQVHKYPRLILNQTDATCTDTIHRVRFKGKHEKQHVAASFINSLTFASSEVKGRSYGGGVLTFEPSEVENLPLPLGSSTKVDPVGVNKVLREDNVQQALDMNDKVLLIDGLGMSKKDVIALRAIWEKLRDRRISRK